MHPACQTATVRGPKQRDRRHQSYDEGSDESATLIKSEPVDIEKETPADDTKPVERVTSDETENLPGFEE
jgi:hypothetical protein